MSRGLTFALDQLPAHMRAQARVKLEETQAKLAAVGTARAGVCEDDNQASCSLNKASRKGTSGDPVRVSHAGENLTLAEWEKRTGVSQRTLRFRVHQGLSPAMILSPATKRKQQIPQLSGPEERLAFHLKAEGLGGFIRQHRFDTQRKWRFDFCYLPAKLAIEVDGGAYTNGRHVRGAGFAKDREKGNAAVMAGWRVLHYLPGEVKSGRAVREIKRALEVFRT